VTANETKKNRNKKRPTMADWNWRSFMVKIRAFCLGQILAPTRESSNMLA
jgi:hypothetical protein